MAIAVATPSASVRAEPARNGVPIGRRILEPVLDLTVRYPLQLRGELADLPGQRESEIMNRSGVSGGSIS